MLNQETMDLHLLTMDNLLMLLKFELMQLPIRIEYIENKRKKILK